MSFRILFVCTGNICRSPIAERLLLARVDAGTAIVVASAGTRAMAGYSMDRAAAHVLRQLGGNPVGHIARQITSTMVSGADLVLTATVAHRDFVIRESPSALRRTFTLREFVRLGAGVGDVVGGDLPQRVAEIVRQRGLLPPATPGTDDIGDPFGAPLPVMEACGQEISADVDALLKLLA